MAAGPHGSTARFNGSTRHNLTPCRCARCRAAHHRYTSRLRHYEHVARTEYRAARPYDTVPAEPITAHIHRLFADGAGWTQIAIAARCSQETISRLHHADTAPVRWTTACRLLAVRPEDATPPSRPVPALGSVRRVRALAAIGHYRTHITKTSAVASEAIGALLHGRQASVAATTAARVAHAYEQLRWTPGTSERMRNKARRLGWHGPLAWDDIDNPDEQPAHDDLPAPEQTTKGTRADAQYIAAEVRHLAALHVPVHEIAARLGRTENYIRSQLRGDRAPGWRKRLGNAA